MKIVNSIKMFKTVRVTKFKGLEDIEITFGKLNIFVGENGVGKSTIAHALGLIKKSSRTTAINTDLPYINLGSIDKLVPSGERASIIISGNTDTKSSTPIGNSLQYEIGIEFDYQGLYST
ncbi:MAG: AAA family ATPase, partial [Thermoplasmatales archaeon]